MSDELIATLADHAAGNYRVLMTLSSDLLAAAVERDLSHLDEKLYFDVFSVPSAAEPREQRPDTKRRRR